MDRSCGVLCCDVLWSSESSEDSAVTCTHATYLGFVSSFKEFIWYQPLPVPECSSQCSAKACCPYMCVCVCQCGMFMQRCHVYNMCSVMLLHPRQTVPHSVHTAGCHCTTHRTCVSPQPNTWLQQCIQPTEPIAGVGVCMVVLFTYIVDF